MQQAVPRAVTSESLGKLWTDIHSPITFPTNPFNVKSPTPPATPPTNTGAAFPKSYTEDLKRAMLEAGKIGRTGCPDYFFQ